MTLKTLDLLIKASVKLDAEQQYAPVLNSTPLAVSSSACVTSIIIFLAVTRESD